MARKFKTVDYEQSGQQTLTIDECLPADHLARFIVAIVRMLDLSVFYAYYAAVGGEPIDPQVLLSLLLYGYATGVVPVQSAPALSTSGTTRILWTPTTGTIISDLTRQPLTQV